MPLRYFGNTAERTVDPQDAAVRACRTAEDEIEGGLHLQDGANVPANSR